MEAVPSRALAYHNGGKPSPSIGDRATDQSLANCCMPGSGQMLQVASSSQGGLEPKAQPAILAIIMADHDPPCELLEVRFVPATIIASHRKSRRGVSFYALTIAYHPATKAIESAFS
jgi:hypothetical protein